jgi:DNA-binding transcriptional MerR regulator
LPETTTLTTDQLSRLSGASLRNLQWWDERGIVTPRQQGHCRYYSAEEAILVLLTVELRRKAIKLGPIRGILQTVRRTPTARFLVTDGRHRHHTVETADQVIECFAKFPGGLYLVDLHQLRLKLANDAGH